MGSYCVKPIFQQKRFTNEQFLELIEKSKTGDEKATEDIISGCHGLILETTNEFYSEDSSFSKEDLYQEAIIAVIMSVNDYNPSSSAKFSTYVKKNIKWKLMRVLTETASDIRLPEYKQAEVNKMRKTARETGTEVKTLDFQIQICSLDTTAKSSDGDKSLTIGDLFQSDGPTVEESAEKNEVSTGILKVLNESFQFKPEYEKKEITEKEIERKKRILNNKREVIIKRFGLNGQEAKTLKEIGKELGLTQERVRQIEISVLSPSGRDRYSKDFLSGVTVYKNSIM